MTDMSFRGERDSNKLVMQDSYRVILSATHSHTDMMECYLYCMKEKRG